MLILGLAASATFAFNPASSHWDRARIWTICELDVNHFTTNLSPNQVTNNSGPFLQPLGRRYGIASCTDFATTTGNSDFKRLPEC